METSDRSKKTMGLLLASRAVTGSKGGVGFGEPVGSAAKSMELDNDGGGGESFTCQEDVLIVRPLVFIGEMSRSDTTRSRRIVRSTGAVAQHHRGHIVRPSGQDSALRQFRATHRLRRLRRRYGENGHEIRNGGVSAIPSVGGMGSRLAKGRFRPRWLGSLHTERRTCRLIQMVVDCTGRWRERRCLRWTARRGADSGSSRLTRKPGITYNLVSRPHCRVFC